MFIVRLPPLFDITFKNKEHEIDDDRWSLLAWVLDFDNDFIEKIRENTKRKSFKDYCAVVITLNYLLKVKDLLVLLRNVLKLVIFHAARRVYSHGS